MFPLRTFLIILTVSFLAPFSHNAALSLYEQKKYKRFLEGQGLYSPDDDVVILTVHNFKSQVMNSPQAWLVEFYNSWCGFCQRFAPSWKALATDIKGWGDMVRVAALDCSVDENAPLCREYEIMAYPTLRYFHEMYTPAPQSLGETIKKGDDVTAHRRFLVQRIVQEQSEGRGRQYPNLLPYPHTNLARLFDNTHPSHQYAFLVIERPQSYLGEEVALDLHKTESIVVRHVFSNGSVLMDNLGVNVVPTVVVLDRSNTYKILASVESRNEVKKTVREYLQSRHVKVTDETPKQEIFTGKWLEVQVPDMSSIIQERARQALRDRIKRMGDVVFQMDLETTIRYSLKHEIATTKLITGEKLSVLRDYVAILRKYFPFSREGQIFLAELALKCSQAEVTGSEIAQIVAQAERENSQVFSSPQQWLACRGSTASFRGYPCGLWKLFHYLTVNAAEQNINNNKAPPLEILNVMYGYVKNFFGCHDCSQHFQDMASRRELRNVSSLDSSVLWLWMAHNEVNKRLAGDSTEDPEYPKYQFPLKERCPSCRNSDSTWNLMEVLKYIKHMYSSINVRYIGADTTVLHSGLEQGRVVTSGGASIFRPLDTSMCFILYVCSFFLLAVLIRMFLKRGYRKKPYVHDLLGKV